MRSESTQTPIAYTDIQSASLQMDEVLSTSKSTNTTLVEETREGTNFYTQDGITESLEMDLNANLVILAYGLIVIVSLVGNLLVCKVAFTGRRCGRNRRQRTTTDLLIGSLALSDLIMTGEESASCNMSPNDR